MYFEKHANWKSQIAFSCFFHNFLTLQISLRARTLISFRLPDRESFFVRWFGVGTWKSIKASRFYEILNFSKNSKSYEIFFSDPGQIQKRNNLDHIYNDKELFGSKFKFRETWSETAIFSKNSTFHKIETLSWIFSKFNPKCS